MTKCNLLVNLKKCDSGYNIQFPSILLYKQSLGRQFLAQIVVLTLKNRMLLVEQK